MPAIPTPSPFKGKLGMQEEALDVLFQAKFNMFWPAVFTTPMQFFVNFTNWILTHHGGVKKWEIQKIGQIS